MKLKRIYFVVITILSVGLCWKVGFEHPFWYGLGLVGCLISGIFLAEKSISWF